ARRRASNGQPGGFSGVQSYPSPPMAFRAIWIKKIHGRVCELTSHAAPASSLPGVREFDRKASFPNLRRVCRSDTRELSSHVIDNVEVAVGTVVVAQPKIRANGL